MNTFFYFSFISLYPEMVIAISVDIFWIFIIQVKET